MKRGSQEERNATVTSGKVETTQKRCLTFTKERRSGSRVISTDNTHKPGGECYLIAQEVESKEYRRKCPVLILL